ncbi:hypothetical protein Gotur_001652 [Gossypium turneri]
MPTPLDDMVNRNNTERGRPRLRPPRPGRMTLATRRGPLASSHKTRSLPWQHDLFEDSLRAAGISGVEVGTKLYVSNLDHGVTNEDIRELFSEIGELKRYSVHYDKNGRSSVSFVFILIASDNSIAVIGSAEVVYLRRSDAFAALKRYNNVLLDGKPMIIEIVGANAEVPVSARINVTGTKGRKKRTVVMTRRGGMTMRSGRGGGRGRGRGRGKRKPMEKSADDLDKELENYHAEAMNVS